MSFFSEWIAPIVLFASFGVIIQGQLGKDDLDAIKDWRFWAWAFWLIVWYKLAGGN